MGIDRKINYERVLTIRPAVKDDIYYGLLDCFSSFGPTVNADEAESQFLSREKSVKTFVVCEDDQKVIGTVSVIIKPGFTHNGRPAAIIEDVATSPLYRNIGVGKMLVNHAISYCRQRGCYKAILDCDEEKESFYKQFGFSRKGMALRLDL